MRTTSQSLSVVSLILTALFTAPSTLGGCGVVEPPFTDAPPTAVDAPVDAPPDAPVCAPEMGPAEVPERTDVIPGPIVPLGEFPAASCDTTQISSLGFIIWKNVPGEEPYPLKNNLSIDGQVAGELRSVGQGNIMSMEFEMFLWEGQIATSQKSVQIMVFSTNCNDPVQVGGSEFTTCLTDWSGTNSLGEPVSVNGANICAVTHMR